MYQSDRLLTRKENLFEPILFLVTVQPSVTPNSACG